ncbi:hypothetical protein HBB16_15800 [Pseudonocardia sp. MCCB 268]|nr:hypothetical protein [Pseudonocardia cytotoxica]
MSAEPRSGGGLTVTTGDGTEGFDHLVVANGIFSEPFLPGSGHQAFRAATARYCPPQVHRSRRRRDRHVVVIGFTASPPATSPSRSTAVSASTTVVAQELLWKMPPDRRR